MSLTIMKSLIVLSAVSAIASGAPQLIYGGYPYGVGGVHAVPTLAKQTVTYKTAAFEPVEADTPADAQLIELKETEHSYDTLVPGPVQYHAAPAVYGLGLHGGLVASPAITEVKAAEVPTVSALPAVTYTTGVLPYHGLGAYTAGYPYGLGIHGLPVVAGAAAPAAAPEAEAEAEE